jgi:predicted SprT family Zn-dependent metalloprotease
MKPAWVDAVIAECRAAVSEAAPKWPYIVKHIEIKLLTRKSRVAGSYRAQRRHDMGHICMNIKLNNTPERFRETLMHEFAHALVNWDGVPDTGHHGPLWRCWMTRLGQDPKAVKHDFDLDEAFGGYYTIIQCSRGHEVKLKPIFVKKIKQGYVLHCCACCRMPGHAEPLSLANKKAVDTKTGS